MPHDFVIEPLALLRCSVFYSCSRSLRGKQVRSTKQTNKETVKLRKEGESQSQLGRGASRRFEQEEDGDERRRRRRRQTRLTTYTRTIPTSKTIVQLHYNYTRTLNIDLVLGGL